MNNKIITWAGYFLVFLSVLILIARVDSLGAAIECAPRTPCTMYAGEERIFNIPLQSSPGEGDTRVRFELIDNAGGIAEIVGDSEFAVPAGSTDVNARLRIKIREDATTVEHINVIIKFSEIPAESDGQVGLSPSFTMPFAITVGGVVPPVAVEKKEGFGAGGAFFLAVMLVLVVLVAITFVLVKNKKELN